MIGTIRRHQKWLWGVIIVATILSFTVYLSPTQRYGAMSGSHGSSGPDLGSVNGEPVTPDQFVEAEREAAIVYRLRAGAWPESEDQKKQLRRIAEQSLVINSLLKEYKIETSTEAAARFSKQMFGVPPDQSMPADRFNEWVENDLKRKGGLTLEDFDRFARHQAAQECLMSLFGMTGKLITPKEAESFYRRENEPMVTEIVSFPASEYYGETVPTETDLQDYFTKHQAEYRLPDRVQINYIELDASNYLAKADKSLGTNIDEKVDEIYHQQNPDSLKDESGKTLTPAAAQALIKKQLRNAKAMQEARNEAYALLNTLSEGHDAAHPYATSDLAKLAKAKDLTCHTTEPFDEKNGCKDLHLSPKVLHVLFSLRDDAPDDPDKSMLYGPSPLMGESNVYITGLQKRLPSQLQSLAAVHDQVVKDFRSSKALSMAADAGEKFARASNAALMQGKSFNAVCAGQNLKPESLPPFALTTTNVPPGLDKSSFQALQETVFPLPVGQSSKFISTADGGLVAYISKRLPVDQARMAQELPIYVARMRERLQVAAFQEWLGHQIQLRLIPPAGDQSSPG
jgi:peptidyl-prolyl cis-trans isomerase D